MHSRHTTTNDGDGKRWICVKGEARLTMEV